MVERLEQIISKVKHLKEENARLTQSTIEKEKHITNLNDEVKNSDQAILNLRKKMEELISEKEQIHLEKLNLESTLKFYTEAPDNMSKKEIKLKIDSYITQIDQCIKLLENN
jgi:regulator of replication initiation timing